MLFLSIFGKPNWLTNFISMKLFVVFSLFFIIQNSYGQVELNADGPGNTYSLITSVLAPNYNPIEAPDCSHTAFGEHIDEAFDDDLGINVFRFYLHTTPDDDRCINDDRQRNEIKTYDQSPDNLLGIEDEIVVYTWKFKLDEGFQSSPNFTHIHQLKSVGGPFAGMPMYTLTTRKGNPDRIELRYAETTAQVTLLQTDLAPFIGTWVDVTETITYGASGTYALEIKRVSDGTPLFTYSNNDIINWREDADFVRPKWGIYRSLLNAQDLRDETVLYANFSIEEVETLSLLDSGINTDSFTISPNPVNDIVYLKNIPQHATLIQLYSIDGRKIMDKPIDLTVEASLDVSSLTAGTYIVTITGKQLSQSKLVLVSDR